MFSKFNEIINPNKTPLHFILLVAILTQISNFINILFIEGFGYAISIVLSIITFLLIVFAYYIYSLEKQNRIKKNKSLVIKSIINSNESIRAHKGLIAFISNPPKNEIEDDWFKYCMNIINGATDDKTKIKVTDISGIGQTFKALYHHIKELKYCWLIYSDESGINIDIIEYFFQKELKNILNPKFIKIDNANDTKHIKEKIDDIYNDLPKDIKVSDVIADITAGNKPMTAGMILACSLEERNIEYIEQSDSKNIIEVDISLKVTNIGL